MNPSWLVLITAAMAFISVTCASRGPPSFMQAPPREYRAQLQGPPSQFKDMAVPSTASASSRDSMGTYRITFDDDFKRGSNYIKFLDIDYVNFRLSLLAEHASEYDIFLWPPGSDRSYNLRNPVHMEIFGGETLEYTLIQLDGLKIPAVTVPIQNSTIGQYKLEIDLKGNSSSHSENALLMVDGDTPVGILAHIQSYHDVLGDNFGVVAQLYDQNEFPRSRPISEMDRPRALQNAVITKASLLVTFPDGSVQKYVMHDDGLHGDLESDDDIYGANVMGSEAGEYTTEVLFEALVDGVKVYRTAYVPVAVVYPTVRMTGTAALTHNDSNGMLSFFIHVEEPEIMKSVLKSAVDNTMLVYSEVWGTVNGTNTFAGVAWAESMVDVEIFGGLISLRLDLDEMWLQVAGATLPLELRNVTVQDRSTFTVIDSIEKVTVQSAIENLESILNSRLDYTSQDLEITEKMRRGPLPEELAHLAAPTEEKRKIVLVHGYCADGNPFSIEDFPKENTLVFLDLKQGRSIDEFALRLRDFINKHNSNNPVALIAHSQGGMASTHLQQFYHTGVNSNAVGRPVQSVGSPYLGSELATGLLKNIFSAILCVMTPVELSQTGALIWMSRMRKDLNYKLHYYYTTADSPWYDVLGTKTCKPITNYLMTGPNDGAVSKINAWFPGATDGGNTLNFCHSTDMTHTPQCHDHVRNKRIAEHAMFGG